MPPMRKPAHERGTPQPDKIDTTRLQPFISQKHITATNSGNTTPTIETEGSASAIQWPALPLPFLLTYRFSHRLSSPTQTPYTHPFHQIVLTNRTSSSSSKSSTSQSLSSRYSSRRQKFSGIGIGNNSPTAVARRCGYTSLQATSSTISPIIPQSTRRQRNPRTTEVKKEDVMDIDHPILFNAQVLPQSVDKHVQDDSSVKKKRPKHHPTTKKDLAMSVRRHFNSMSADEIGIAAGLIYKVRHQDDSFRLRQTPHRNTNSSGS